MSKDRSPYDASSHGGNLRITRRTDFECPGVERLADLGQLFVRNPRRRASKDVGVHDAFADVLDSAATAVMNGVDDPYDFDEPLEADDLGGAASQVRDAFRWLQPASVRAKGEPLWRIV
ncbi:hypothetical protein [Streptomyces sp. NPDC029004]|uniref:hypothetical protein n=1 Tax=Streptomyces sp. NPDC029004 TaxID=3154490 RepID=UPI0034012715